MDEEKGDPTWMYRMGPDGVEGRIFDSLRIPDGWYDSPAHIPQESVETVPKRRGRPRKVRDGDSA